MSAHRTHISPARKRRILLVDDHTVVRESLAQLINGQGDLEVCCQTDSANKALGIVARSAPDLVVVDLSLKDGSGLELIKQIAALRADLPIMVLSMHDENIYAERALRAGALGYVMKSEDSQTVMRALRRVLQGQVHVSEAMSECMVHKLVGRPALENHSGVAHLSDRELEVFKLLGEGHTTRQIAQRLHMSMSTVETHRAHLKEKMHLENAAELIRAAVQWVSAIEE